jgi:hypothetical protein
VYVQCIAASACCLELDETTGIIEIVIDDHQFITHCSLNPGHRLLDWVPAKTVDVFLLHPTLCHHAPLEELLSYALSPSLSGKVLFTTLKNRWPLALNPTASVVCASCYYM